MKLKGCRCKVDAEMSATPKQGIEGSVGEV